MMAHNHFKTSYVIRPRVVLSKILRDDVCQRNAFAFDEDKKQKKHKRQVKSTSFLDLPSIRSETLLPNKAWRRQHLRLIAGNTSEKSWNTSCVSQTFLESDFLPLRKPTPARAHDLDLQLFFLKYPYRLKYNSRRSLWLNTITHSFYIEER